MEKLKNAVAAVLSICLVFCAFKFTLPYADTYGIKSDNALPTEVQTTVADKENITDNEKTDVFDGTAQTSEGQAVTQTDGSLLTAESAEEKISATADTPALQLGAESYEGENVYDETTERQPDYEIAAPADEASADENDPLYGLVSKADIAATPGRTYSGMLYSASEMHIYNFTVSARGYIGYTLEHEELTDLSSWKVYLFAQYSPDGSDEQKSWRLLNVLNSTQSSKSDTSSNIGVMPGSYRIVIASGRVYEQHTYKLTINVTDSSAYEIEYNDTITRYTEIASNTTVSGSASYFDSGKDSDWYLINTYTPGYITLTFEHEKGEAASVCFKVSVYDINGNEICSDNSFFGTQKLTMLSGVGAGHYFIEVRSIVYAAFDYKLTVTRTPQANFETEPNNTAAAADVISTGSVYSASLNTHSSDTDIDYFSFTLSENGYVKLNFAHEADAVTDENDDPKDGWRIKLLNSDGNVLWLQTSQWTDTGKESPLIGLGVGTYYISVDCNGFYFDPRVYTIKVDFTATNGWEKEYNNTQELSTPVVEHIAYSASLTETGTDYDTDWFSFTLTEAKRVNVLLSHETQSTDRSIFVFSVYNADGVRLNVEDQNGNELLDSAGNNVQLVTSRFNTANVNAMYTLGAGTYYIRVTSATYFSNMRYNISYSGLTN